MLRACAQLLWMWTGNIHWWNNHSNSDLLQSSKHSYLGFCPVILHVHLRYSWSSCYILNLLFEFFVALFMNDDYLPLYHGIPDVRWLFVIAIFTGDSPHTKEAGAHLHPLRGYLSGRTDRAEGSVAGHLLCHRQWRAAAAKAPEPAHHWPLTRCQIDP